MSLATMLAYKLRNDPEFYDLARFNLVLAPWPRGVPPKDAPEQVTQAEVDAAFLMLFDTEPAL